MLTLSGKTRKRIRYLFLLIPIIYIAMLLGQPAGFDIPKIVQTIRDDPTVIIQQLINGLANGAIIAIIALGYTMVYGIIELVNFANGDVYMLGTMAALFALSPFILIDPTTTGQTAPWWAALLAFIPAMLVGALINFATERIAYRRLRNSPKIVVLISAIGMSFILQNVGLQIASFGKLANLGGGFSVFGVFGDNNAAPKSFPRIFSDDNLIDYIIAPPPLPTDVPNAEGTPNAGAGAGSGGSQANTKATEDAAIFGTQTAEAKLPTEVPTVDAAIPTMDPTQAAEETAIIATLNAEDAQSGTPEAPSATIDATETPEVGVTLDATPQPDRATTAEPAEPTLDPTQAVEETAIIGTLEAEDAANGTPQVAAVGADGGATPGDGTPNPEATAQAVIDAATTSEDVVQAPKPTNKIRVTFKDVLVIGVAMILMLALNWFVQSTRLGKAMRATAQNRAAAQIMGVNVDNIISLTFIIGGALAGAAGMMSGIYIGTAVFTMGFTAGLRSFTAAVLGGIGNIRGAALGGILIGIIAAFSDQFLEVRWTNAWVFLILVLVLVFRPTGLLGAESGEKA